MVLDAMRRFIFEFGLREKNWPEDIDAVLLAAAWHDAVQDKGADNERLSVEALQEALNGYLIHRVFPEAIMGTVCDWSKTPMVQAAASSDNHLVRLLADADLCSVGSVWSVFYKMSTLLKEEMEKKKGTEISEKDFWVGQRNFITGREFLTEEARILFPHMQENLERVGRILETL